MLRTIFLYGIGFWFLFQTFPLQAQSFHHPVIRDTCFPEDWDTKQTLRSHSAVVLAWAQTVSYQKDHRRFCLVFREGTDSLGNKTYTISEQYADKKPFRKWKYAWTYIAPRARFADSVVYVGKYYVHIEVLKELPDATALYGLLKGWQFFLIERPEKTIQAGIDSKLWYRIFGCWPDWKLFVRPDK